MGRTASEDQVDVYPEDCKYTRDHEWVRRSDAGDTVRVGVTSYAQDALGDVVFVSLPEIGADVESGQALGEIESTKSVADVYAPVSGTVVARNDALEATPELVNSDPYGDGWIAEIRLGSDASLDELLSADAYQQLVAEQP